MKYWRNIGIVETNNLRNLNYWFSKDAERDMRGILAYTASNWGEVQLGKYREKFSLAFRQISEYPYGVRSREKNNYFPGCITYKCEQHVIFYRVVEEEIEIVRILHSKMDFMSRFQ